jgi:hypothetical protein
VGTLTLDAIEGHRIALYLDVRGADLCAAMLLGDALDPVQALVEGESLAFFRWMAPAVVVPVFLGEKNRHSNRQCSVTS